MSDARARATFRARAGKRKSKIVFLDEESSSEDDNAPAASDPNKLSVKAAAKFTGGKKRSTGKKKTVKVTLADGDSDSEHDDTSASSTASTVAAVTAPVVVKKTRDTMLSSSRRRRDRGPVLSSRRTAATATTTGGKAKVSVTLDAEPVQQQQQQKTIDSAMQRSIYDKLMNPQAMQVAFDRNSQRTGNNKRATTGGGGLPADIMARLKKQQESKNDEHENNSDDDDDEEGHGMLVLPAGMNKRSTMPVMTSTEAKLSRSNRTKVKGLCAAAAAGNVKRTMQYITEGCCNVDDSYAFGETPLIVAANKGKLAVVESLIRAKADVNRVCFAGNSALMKACSNRHVEICKFLLFKKADPSAQNTAKDTPLIHAVKAEDRGLVKLLLSFGANVELTDPDGDTAFDWGTLEFKKMICSHILDKNTPRFDDSITHMILSYANYAETNKMWKKARGMKSFLKFGKGGLLKFKEKKRRPTVSLIQSKVIMEED